MLSRCIISFGRMFCLIAFTMFLWCDDFKRLIVTQHGENDITDLMHNCPDSHVFLLALAFVGVVAVDNRVNRHFAALIHFEVVQCDHVENSPGKAGTPLGHMDPVAIELAGLLYSRIQAKVRIKLLWRGKQVKGTHFCDQHNGAEKPNTAHCLEKADAVIYWRSLQFIHSFM